MREHLTAHKPHNGVAEARTPTCEMLYYFSDCKTVQNLESLDTLLSYILKGLHVNSRNIFLGIIKLNIFTGHYIIIAGVSMDPPFGLHSHTEYTMIS